MSRFISIELLKSKSANVNPILLDLQFSTEVQLLGGIYIVG